jgi:acetoin utilization deacetylase AcuC-like enzyme
MKIITNDTCTSFRAAGHPEHPARITNTRKLLEEQRNIEIEWVEPAPCGNEQILRAHCPQYLERLQEKGDLDGDTPWFENIESLARTSAGAALEAMRLARSGERAFSLMRPPGHHATPSRAMGFCYLGNMGIAAMEALETGAGRVAIYDFDVHHGNGTEAILVEREGVQCASIHQSPCFPGTGLEDVGSNCFNYPVRPFLSRQEYRDVLRRALDRLMKSDPAIVGVAAGFDSYDGDPLAQELLEIDDYHWLGDLIGQIDVPVFHMLEGGYSDALPELVQAYLLGVEGK